jgi:hypothetical protein
VVKTQSKKLAPTLSEGGATQACSDAEGATDVSSCEDLEIKAGARVVSFASISGSGLSETIL